MATRRKHGETTGRIHKLLRRTPDLTTNEIAKLLPDVSPAVVQVTVSPVSYTHLTLPTILRV